MPYYYDPYPDELEFEVPVGMGNEFDDSQPVKQTRNVKINTCGNFYIYDDFYYGKLHIGGLQDFANCSISAWTFEDIRPENFKFSFEEIRQCAAVALIANENTPKDNQPFDIEAWSDEDYRNFYEQCKKDHASADMVDSDDFVIDALLIEPGDDAGQGVYNKSDVMFKNTPIWKV